MIKKRLFPRRLPSAPVGQDYTRGLMTVQRGIGKNSKNPLFRGKQMFMRKTT